MATFSNSDPYLAIERALRAARRPSDEGPRARAMWDQYQADQEPYGNRPWKPTPGPVITEREVEAVADELGVSDEEAAELIRQTAQAARGDASDPGWMAQGLQQYAALNAAIAQAPTLRGIAETFSKVGKPETWSTPEKATPEKAALTPATPPPAYEPPAPIAALPPAQQLSLEELGAEMGRAQMAAASYNPRGVTAEEAPGIEAEPTEPTEQPGPQSQYEETDRTGLFASPAIGRAAAENPTLRLNEMFTQPQSLLALLEPPTPAQPPAPAAQAARAGEPGLGRTPGFASRGLAASAINPEEVGIPGPDIAGARAAGLASGVGLPGLAYAPATPAFDVPTPALAYAPSVPAFESVATPGIAYAPSMPAFDDVETAAIAYNPQAPVAEVTGPALAYAPQAPVAEVTTPALSYNPQAPEAEEVETPTLAYAPAVPEIASALRAAQAVAELEMALNPQARSQTAALNQNVMMDVPAVSTPAGPAVSSGNWNEFNPSPTVTRAFDPVGAVSAKEESGGRGVGFVSSGLRDPGGPSYGIHQLSSAYSMGAFLRSPEGRQYAPAFAGMRPGTPAFNATYRAVTARDPEGMRNAQYNFYSRTHFQPVLEMARKAGFDVNNRGVQEALFSAAIQHSGRGNQSIIAAAARRGVGKTAEDQIKNLYTARANYVSQVNLAPDVQRSIQNRYAREVQNALRASQQSSSVNSSFGGGFDDRSSALGGYTEVAGPRQRASLGLEGLINSLLGIQSAAAAELEPSTFSAEGNEPAEQSAPAAAAAVAGLGFTPTGLTASEPSAAMGAQGGAGGGSSSAPGETGLGGGSTAGATGLGTGGLGVAGETTGATGQGVGGVGTGTGVGQGQTGSPTGFGVSEAESPEGQGIGSSSLGTGTAAPTEIGLLGPESLAASLEAEVAAGLMSPEEANDIAAMAGIPQTFAAPAPAAQFAPQAMATFNAPNVQAALSQMTPPGMPAYASFRAAQEQGIESEEAEESQGIETSFSNAFSDPSAFSGMAGLGTSFSGVDGIGVGTAPAGVESAGFSDPGGMFGGVGMGQAAAETSASQMSSLGLEGMFSSAFSDPSAYSGVTSSDPSSTSSEDSDDSSSAESGMGAEAAGAAADAAGVAGGGYGESDGPGNSSDSGMGGSESGGSDGGGGFGGSADGMSGGGYGEGSGPGGDADSGGSASDGGGFGGDSGGGFGSGMGGDDAGGAGGWSRGGYIDETFMGWSDAERDRAVRRALRAAENMLRKEYAYGGRITKNYNRGGEVVYSSVDYFPGGLSYEQVIERALRAAR